MGERQSGYRCVSFVKYSQFTDRLLLHIRLAPRKGRHDSAAQFFCSLCRKAPAKINCTECLIRRCRALQHAKVLRDTVMSRLLGCNHMCSSTLFVNCEQVAKDTVEKILCRPPISQRSHVGNLHRTIKQGKGRSSKRKGNHRCPFLFAPAAGAATLPPSADGESPR